MAKEGKDFPSFLFSSAAIQQRLYTPRHSSHTPSVSLKGGSLTARTVSNWRPACATDLPVAFNLLEQEVAARLKMAKSSAGSANCRLRRFGLSLAG